MIRVRVRHLPPQSATGQALGLDTGWTVGDYLLADVFQALTAKRHPARPRPQKQQARKTMTRRRAEQRAAAMRRKRAREEQIAAGVIT